MAGKEVAERVRAGISVIGAGNWGSSLATAVAASGTPLLEVIVHRPENVGSGEVGRSWGKAEVVLLSEASLDAEVLWICVPDGQITGVAEEIARRRVDLRGQTVVHSSGALTVETLAAAKDAGAEVGGIAPIFSFPTREPVALAGVMFVVEFAAGEVETGEVLTELVERLDGRALRVASEDKVLYHAAATMASPLLMSALDAAVETAVLAGLSREDAVAVIGALALGTARNYFEKGAAESFSGAFARGDIATVELHLKALLAHRNVHHVYVALARNAVASLPVENRGEFERILDQQFPRERLG